MGHAVFHRTATGGVTVDDVASLDAALELVERLRDQGASDIRVFREVPVEVRTYYRAVALEAAGESADTTTESDPAAQTRARRRRSAEPPAGAMPLTPSTTVTLEPPSPAPDGDERPTAAAGAEQRRPLFNRG